MGIILILSAVLQTGFAQNKELKAFPAARKGFQRYVIQVPEKEKENNYQVEIIAGKTKKVDCNQHGLIGKFQTKDVKGWGYTYYEYLSNGQTRSTLMACPDKTLQDRFIADSKLVRYNSRLPLVVYVPIGFQVKYRIWERGALETDATAE